MAITYRLGSVVRERLCILEPNAHMDIGKQIVPVIVILSLSTYEPIARLLAI
jgi:hypothetical protein